MNLLKEIYTELQNPVILNLVTATCLMAVSYYLFLLGENTAAWFALYYSLSTFNHASNYKRHQLEQEKLKQIKELQSETIALYKKRLSNRNNNQ
jgi:hypothetical protein